MANSIGASAAEREYSLSTALTEQSISYTRALSATVCQTARGKPQGNPKKYKAYGSRGVYSQSSNDVCANAVCMMVVVADNINDEPGKLEGDKIILATSGQPFLLVSQCLLLRAIH